METTLTERRDPRVLRTHRALQDALISLVDEGGTVTMSAVAQRAGLSRQVLHTHYDSIEQLAATTLARRLLEGAGRVVDVAVEPVTPLLVDAVRSQGLAPFLQVMHDDAVVVTALRKLAHASTAVILSDVFAELAVVFVRDAAAVPSLVAARFVAGGITTSVDAWLEQEHSVSATDLALTLIDFARAVFAADGQPDRNGPER